MWGDQSMQNAKAIFLDMDGTLLNSQNQVSQNTKETIDRVRRKGIYVFIVTGRGKEEIFTKTPAGFKVDGVISSNGMTGYIGTEKLFEHAIPFTVVEKIIKQARKHQVYYELFPTSGAQIVERQDQANLFEEVEEPKPDVVGINEWMERKLALEKGIRWVDQIEARDYSKFYFFSKSPEKIQAWKEVLTELNQELPFSTSSSTINNVEVMVANKNKATGIEQVLEYLNLSADEIVAVGDSFNDESMFKLAGYSVAMKNAPDEIKQMTDEVTQFTNDEEGVAHFLKTNFL